MVQNMIQKNYSKHSSKYSSKQFPNSLKSLLTSISSTTNPQRAFNSLYGSKHSSKQGSKHSSKQFPKESKLDLILQKIENYETRKNLFKKRNLFQKMTHIKKRISQNNYEIYGIQKRIKEIKRLALKLKIFWNVEKNIHLRHHKIICRKIQKKKSKN